MNYRLKESVELSFFYASGGGLEKYQDVCYVYRVRTSGQRIERPVLGVLHERAGLRQNIFSHDNGRGRAPEHQTLCADI